MLNRIVIMGRMARDPEIRYTQSQTPVASFTLAVERDYAAAGEKRESDFIDCVAWRGTADFVHNFFSKGSMAIVSGRLQMRKWEDRDGNKRTSAEIVADTVYFGESRKREDAQTAPAEPKVFVRENKSKFQEMDESDPEDLPF